MKFEIIMNILSPGRRFFKHGTLMTSISKKQAAPPGWVGAAVFTAAL